MELPEGFKRRLEKLLGTESEAFFRSLEKEPSRAFRFDQEKTDQNNLREIFGGKLFSPVPFCENSFRFQIPSLGNHPLHQGGALYVQEPAAMAPVAALGKEKCFLILDLCAAPGGKSLQAAELLTSDGVIVSNEPHPARRKVLMQNIERVGLRNSMVTGFDATNLPPFLEEAFDLVICDVPCSGEGMIRKNQAAAEMWSEENILLCARRQREILKSAAKAVAPGGRILYSTCTWAKEENEDQIENFLEDHPEFSLEEAREEVKRCAAPGISSQIGSFDLSRCLRFYPHLFDGEGQFLAILRKDGAKTMPVFSQKGKEKHRKEKEKNKTDLLVVDSFLREVFITLPQEEVSMRGENVYFVPKTAFPTEEFVSPGVLIGTVQKGRVIPHHRLFIAFACLFRNQVVLSLQDERVGKFLRGEEIDLSEFSLKGWAVLFAGKCPLGGVKISSGKGKNYYPKGLRVQEILSVEEENVR